MLTTTTATIGRILLNEKRRFMADAIEVAETAERRGFPLLAARILDFVVETEGCALRDFESARSSRAWNALSGFRAELRDLDAGWRAAYRQQPVKPEAFEANR